ncbi:hypothetical protein TNCV_67661 [Trichonephila clavipes]|nr:hypothetical protein TNCV_67661 [Trichonephila clavipes]
MKIIRNGLCNSASRSSDEDMNDILFFTSVPGHTIRELKKSPDHAVADSSSDAAEDVTCTELRHVNSAMAQSLL